MKDTKEITGNDRQCNLDNIFIGIFLAFMLLTISCGQKEDLPVYKNSNLPVEERVEDLLARMTLKEKIEQLSGLGFVTKENKRLGIPV